MVRVSAAVVVCGFALCIAADPVRAGEFESSAVVLHSTSDPIQFDFSTSAAALNQNPKITEVETIWRFVAGNASVDISKLTAGLAIPNFALGDRIPNALDVNLNLGKGKVAVTRSSVSDPGGLAIGDTILEEFKQGDNDLVRADLFTSAAVATELDGFFAAGGSAEVKLRLTIDDPEPTGPTGPTGPVPGPAPPPTSGGITPSPEPGSVLVWGVACATVVARAWRRRKAATVEA